VSQQGQYALVSYIAMYLKSKTKSAMNERNIYLSLGMKQYGKSS
jgi:hypothetical protein